MQPELIAISLLTIGLAGWLLRLILKLRRPVFLLGLQLHHHRAGDDHRAHVRRDLAALDDGRHEGGVEPVEEGPELRAVRLVL